MIKKRMQTFVLWKIDSLLEIIFVPINKGLILSCLGKFFKLISKYCISLGKIYCKKRNSLRFKKN